MPVANNSRDLEAVIVTDFRLWVRIGGHPGRATRVTVRTGVGR